MAICDWGAKWSRGKWWLWAILGLLALYLLMLYFKWDPIEKDIQARTNAALAEQGHGWATANLDMRGRDVMLSGEAPNEEAKQAAVDVARSVEGVRVVDSDFGLKSYRPASLSLSDDGNRVALKGELASQAAVDQAVSAASDLYGADRIENHLTVSGDVAAAGWIGGLPSAVQGLATVSNADLAIDADSAVLKGVVRSEDAKSSVFNVVNAALGGSVDNQLMVKPLSLPSLNVSRSGDNIVLQGIVDSQETSDDLAGRAATVVGEANVDNQLAISSEVSRPDWLGGVGRLFGLLPTAWQLNYDAGEVTVAGEVDDDVAKVSILDRAKSLFAGVNVVDGLTVKPKPVVVQEVVKAPEPSELEMKISACQTQINDTMAGQKIHFATNSADINQGSHALLDLVAVIVKECEAYLADTSIEVSGHTDSVGDEAYNQRLSGMRASSVVEYLINAGVSGGNLEAVGYGETRPVASNDTADGRAENRRIQFEIKK